MLLPFTPHFSTQFEYAVHFCTLLGFLAWHTRHTTSPRSTISEFLQELQLSSVDERRLLIERMWLPSWLPTTRMQKTFQVLYFPRTVQRTSSFCLSSVLLFQQLHTTNTAYSARHLTLDGDDFDSKEKQQDEDRRCVPPPPHGKVFILNSTSTYCGFGRPLGL